MANPVGRPKTGRQLKTEVLQLRLTPKEKKYIMDVSELECESAAEFILKAVVERAERLEREYLEKDNLKLW